MQRREFIKWLGVGTGVGAVMASDRGFTQDADFTFYSALAEQWYRQGKYFEWTSTTEYNNERKVNVFYRQFGDPQNPALLLVHGYPTSSFDYRELIAELEQDYYLCTLDFPGFGFSDKPQQGYSYMLADDARLLHHFVHEILGLKRFSLYTHDRGVSVGLAFLDNYLQGNNQHYQLDYHFMSNSGMFLPLANLFEGQTVLLDPVRGPEAIRQLKAVPRRTEGTPEQLAYADIHAFNDGIGARLGVGKYLLERAVNETRWLELLPTSPVPVGYLWGMLDVVNPVRIANHVWSAYLNEREQESSFWYIPLGGHYPQRDQPAQVARVIRMCLQGQVPAAEQEDAFMRSYAASREQDWPMYVGRSRVRQMEFPGAVPYSPSGYRY